MAEPDAPPARPWLRRAGRAGRPDGAVVVWSVAEGRRGRRWRESVTRIGRLQVVTLLETDPEGRFARLEAATAAGMLTLHASGDGRSVHGNVVTPAGVRHLALDWGPAHRLVVEGSPAAAATVARSFTAEVDPGGIGVSRGLAVDLRLRVVDTTLRAARTAGTRWVISAPLLGIEMTVELDSEWVPRAADGSEWPLEL